MHQNYNCNLTQRSNPFFPPTWALIALRCICATLKSNRFIEISSCNSFALLYNADSADRCWIRNNVSNESCICLIWESRSFASFLKASWDGRTWTAESLSITSSSFRGGGIFSCKHRQGFSVDALLSGWRWCRK